MALCISGLLCFQYALLYGNYSPARYTPSLCRNACRYSRHIAVGIFKYFKFERLQGQFKLQKHENFRGINQASVVAVQTLEFILFLAKNYLTKSAAWEGTLA